ncbi:hypothetical protein EU75_15385, partial [Staphylococcus aureus]
HLAVDAELLGGDVLVVLVPLEGGNAQFVDDVGNLLDMLVGQQSQREEVIVVVVGFVLLEVFGHNLLVGARAAEVVPDG